MKYYMIYMKKNHGIRGKMEGIVGIIGLGRRMRMGKILLGILVCMKGLRLRVRIGGFCLGRCMALCSCCIRVGISKLGKEINNESK